MLTDFKWPVPPHYDLISHSGGPDGTDVEPALVTMQNGRSQDGLLVRLDGAEMFLEFRTRRAASSVRIGFGNLKLLRLTDPVEMQQLRLSEALSRVSTGATGQQKCVVQYHNGDALETPTLGLVSKPFGLFLYVPVGAQGKVERCFIPAEAIKSYQIGEQLGKMLIDENIVTKDHISAGLEKQEQMRSQKLGDYLKQQKIITQEHVEIALQSQKGKPQLRLGEALLQENLISEKQLSDALANQAQNRKVPLGDILVEMKIVTLDTIKRVLAQKLGIPFVNLRGFNFDPALIKAVPGDFVRKYNVMPLYQTEARMVVAMENPLANHALQELAFYTKLKIDPVMASVEDLQHVIGQLYGTETGGSNIAELVYELGADDIKFDTPVEMITESDNTLVRLVNKIIIDAYNQGVSDIHVENMKGNRPTRVRFRKDGVMQAYSEIPAQFRNALVSRIKIMCRLDISEKRRSQDGKMNFEQFGPAAIELRVLTIPTTEGLEDIVMRILAAPKAVSIESLGLSTYGIEGLKKLALKPHGLLFVCGPTGSGKTTTLHSLLNFINTPERKIWTVEDPVEITQDGLRQVQVQAKIDWTFAAVLRSFMRADPDVIMVGETRDPETAKTVIEASLTGHLVFSTMHTNSAAESVVRLLDFGLDPFNFADALLGVVGQRLARRLCSNCKTVHYATDEELNMLAQEYCFETDIDPADMIERWRTHHGRDGGKIGLFKAKGCETCSDSGYKGRLGVHEVLIATAAVKKKIHARANVPEILKVAVSEGMLTLRQDGIEKIFQGHTDWEQIRTV
ncbi:type II secretory ATPase GspE/PulE/Tfp pilus assembly ATPase PilB-like protein [Actimicrobium sp. GrIS 1.19]|uniref:GspE/PulE family protein n=1 Tax=Actimicrobium sp. GrIS 1.19 TaxID=3071708 RepID=UPI002DFFE718|nr:type II secretory ATPase GspE/PulE/Tfp pilus assembly ATPase PilB-like protein [Actimicrobium sp. GrIS 1.19]